VYSCKVYSCKVYSCKVYSCKVYRCAGVHLCRCTGVQVYRCAVACLLSGTERRTHKRDTQSAHTHTHTHTSRCAVATTVGRPTCKCVCASVEHRPNPDPQPFSFSVCNNMSGTSLVRPYCVPAVCCCQIYKERCRISFLPLVPHNFTPPLPFARLRVRYTKCDVGTDICPKDGRSSTLTNSAKNLPDRHDSDSSCTFIP